MSELEASSMGDMGLMGVLKAPYTPKFQQRCTEVERAENTEVTGEDADDQRTPGLTVGG